VDLHDIGDGNGDLKAYGNEYVEFSDQGVRFKYKTDEDGRITELIIGGNFDKDIDIDIDSDSDSDSDSDEDEDNAIGSYDLPADVARLDKLTDLEVVNCRSLPLELSCLPELDRLELRRCSDLLNSFPTQMNLPHCKYLAVTDCQLQSTSPFLAWLTKQVPNLKNLSLSQLEEHGTTFILDALRITDVCFQNTLKDFTMFDCGTNSSHLDALAWNMS